MDIKPVENYSAPKIPTLTEVSNQPAPLKKLPHRWKKHAMVVAGVGILKLSALFGCYISNCDSSLDLRIHHGGAGFASYVVHLTEQEAFDMIRTRLEAAGLTFDAEPPAYIVEHWLDDIYLDLFDSERGVAVSHLSWEDSHRAFSARGRWFTKWATGEFAEQTDLLVGVFYNPGDEVRGPGSPHRGPTPSRFAVNIIGAQVRPELEERLNQQIDDFIEQLRHLGIIE